jgi:hypothetical protein
VSARATAAAPAVRPRRTTAPARPLVVPRPRRVSGPARRGDERRGIGDRPARRRSEGKDGIALGVLAGIERLGRRRSLGGRTWIALVAFALIGIVTLQLGLLKLNAGIGRALEHEALLQRENAALSIEDSELAASDRVISQAVKLGMETVPTRALRFLSVRPRVDPARSRAALSTPVHASATGSAEPSGGGSTAVPSSSVSSTSAEPSTPEVTRTASAESTTAAPATTPSSGERPERGAGEPARTPGESASPSTTATAPATPAGGGSTEGTPAGGTRAGSSG